MRSFAPSTPENKGGTVDIYSLATSYREEGKNLKQILLRLGPLTKEQAEGYRVLLRNMNRVGAGDLDKDKLLKNINSIEIEESKKYPDCLVLNEIWKQLRLSDCFPIAKKNKKNIFHFRFSQNTYF